MSSNPTGTIPGVLIVGAGPAGLTAALTLAKNGVPVRIIDKDSSFYAEQRGSGIHPRTLELFNYLEILSDVHAKGMPLLPFRQYKLPGGAEPLEDGYLIEPTKPKPDIPYTNPWVLGQCHTQAILRSHLAKYEYHVELSTELRSFEQSSDGVHATIVKIEDGKETVTNESYHWVIAADGGRSSVRKQLGIAFEGLLLPDRMIIGEIDVQGLDHDHWHRWGDFNLSQPMVMIRPTETNGLFWFALRGNIDYEDALSSPEALLRNIRKHIERQDLVFGKLHYMTDYRPSARVAERINEGRAFLVGDAAHVHSPMGGQGLNTSVQDAFNLAWKLALVENGVAAPSLVSTYSEERLPVIKRMVEETMTMFNSVAREQSPQTAPKGERPFAVWRQRAEHLRQLGVNYRWSSIVVDERHVVDMEHVKESVDPYSAFGGDGLHSGDRAPDAPGLIDLKDAATAKTKSLFQIYRSTYHTVLVFSKDPAFARSTLEIVKPYPEGLLRVVVIYPQDGLDAQTVDGADEVLLDRDGHAYTGYGCAVDGSSIIIVRPDGVAGGIVSGEEGLKKYLGLVFSVC